jgi:hypothetical protein
VGAYHSFDRKEAEGHARALAKRREREAREAEEKRIWSQLADEQIIAARAKALAPAAARAPKAKKSVEELALEAIEEAVAEYERHAGKMIAALRQGHCPIYWKRRQREIDQATALAFLRYHGACIDEDDNAAGYSFPYRVHMRRCLRLIKKGSPLWGSGVARLLYARTVLVDIRVRMVVRNILRHAAPSLRSEILEVFHRVRAETHERCARRREGEEVLAC